MAGRQVSLRKISATMCNNVQQAQTVAKTWSNNGVVAVITAGIHFTGIYRCLSSSPLPTAAKRLLALARIELVHAQQGTKAEVYMGEHLLSACRG